MLRKIPLVGISAALILPILSTVSNAVILVPSYGKTGWQTYSHTFDEVSSGLVGIGVSDYGDFEVCSYLLIDNLVNMGPPGNESFEMGSFLGYWVSGTGASIDTSATSRGGTTYTPTDGSNMAVLSSTWGWSGASTSVFGGICGTWIEFPVSAGVRDQVSFDRNFLTNHYVPYYDLAFLYAVVPGVGMVLLEYLAQVAEIREPCMLLLFGSGLIGLSAFTRRLGKG